MTRQDPVVDIQSLADQVEYVSVVCYVRLWYLVCDGYLWFHLSAVINIPTGSGNINTTIQTLNGEVVPVTMPWSSHLL